MMLLVTQTGLTRCRIEMERQFCRIEISSCISRSQDFLINQNQSRFNDAGVHFSGRKGTQRVDEIHVYRCGFSSILSNRCCFLSFLKKRFSYPCRVRWRVGYGGNNVGALSKSAKERERQRKERKKRQIARERTRGKAPARDNGRRQWGWAEDEGGEGSRTGARILVDL